MEMVINCEKISRFSRCALSSALGEFLRVIGGKIAGIPQCLALGTTLFMNIKMEFCRSVSVRFCIQEGHLFMQQDECLNFIIHFMLHYHVTASQDTHAEVK